MMATRQEPLVNGTNLSLDEPQFVAQFDQFKADTEFLESLRPELIQKYPGQWVAVYRKRVVATDKSLKNVIKQLDESGVPKSRTVIDCMVVERVSLIL